MSTSVLTRLTPTLFGLGAFSALGGGVVGCKRGLGQACGNVQNTLRSGSLDGSVSVAATGRSRIQRNSKTC